LNRISLCLFLALIAAPLGIKGQGSNLAPGALTDFPDSNEAMPSGSLAGGPAPDPGLPSAPEPSGAGGNPQREGVPWDAIYHQPPFSRLGIGVSFSALGIGIQGAINLNEHYDARALFNFFSFDSGRIEVNGFNVDGKLHLASSSAMLDLYPWNSIWRLSIGGMLYNSNQITTTVTLAPNTSFTLDSTTYYSSTANPVSGTALLGMHTINPAPMASFGFGKFVPRSNRHWSFPSEFGVFYMGAPKLTITTAGSVCTNSPQTNCSDITDPTNPIAIEFNSQLQAKEANWRKDVDKVKLYPIISSSVVYSFNIR